MITKDDKGKIIQEGDRLKLYSYYEMNVPEEKPCPEYATVKPGGEWVNDNGHTLDQQNYECVEVVTDKVPAMMTTFKDYADLTFLSSAMQTELFKRHQHGTLVNEPDNVERILYTEEDVLILLQTLIAEKDAR